MYDNAMETGMILKSTIFGYKQPFSEGQKGQTGQEYFNYGVFKLFGVLYKYLKVFICYE